EGDGRTPRPGAAQEDGGQEPEGLLLRGRVGLPQHDVEQAAGGDPRGHEGADHPGAGVADVRGHDEGDGSQPGADALRRGVPGDEAGHDRRHGAALLHVHLRQVPGGDQVLLADPALLSADRVVHEPQEISGAAGRHPEGGRRVDARRLPAPPQARGREGEERLRRHEEGGRADQRREGHPRVPGPHEAGLRLRGRAGGQGVHESAARRGPGVEVVRARPSALEPGRGPPARDDGGALCRRVPRRLLALRPHEHLHLVRRDRASALRVDRVPGRRGGGAARDPLPPAPPGGPHAAGAPARHPRGGRAGGDRRRSGAHPAGMEAGGAGTVPAHPGHGPLQAVRLCRDPRRRNPDHPLQPAPPPGRAPRRIGPRTRMIAIIGLCFLVFLGLGVPVAFTIAVAGFAGLWWSGEYPLTVIVKQIFEGIASFVLLAIPLFILAGAFMETGGIAVRLVRLAQVLVGWIRGGLSMAVVVAEYIFSGISGSTVADVSAIGSTMIPPMLRAGYRPEQAVAVVASAMGILVPPCILMIVIGSVANVSVAALFAAGFLPAVVLALAIMVYIWYDAGRSGIEARARATWTDIWRAFVDAIIPLGLPAIIFGGILGGVVTPTEA